MIIKEGKYTVETFAKARGLTRQSAINLLSSLKRQGRVQTSGGGRQKRIYTITTTTKHQTNGFYDVVNKYSPEKLVPKFRHHVIGRYSIEQAIIDGIRIGDVRTLEATQYLFLHITNWKRLFLLAKKNKVTEKVYEVYQKARKNTRTRNMPKRYQR